MKIVNFGSLNIDNVYQMPHFVGPGETAASLEYQRFVGGKGCNQSIAVARAGAKVSHAGKIGSDGIWLRDLMREYAIDTTHIEVIDGPSGHAIIQVDPSGENSIILHGGANTQIDSKLIEQVFDELTAGDILILQNEISAMPEILSLAATKDLMVFFNPAPMSPEVLAYPLINIDHFIINQVEGEQFTGESTPDAILSAMRQRFPLATVLLTMGEDGVIADSPTERVQQQAMQVTCVDSTGAGDTFIGYYVAEFARGSSLQRRLEVASRASALCVTRRGAAQSIPSLEEVLKEAQ